VISPASGKYLNRDACGISDDLRRSCCATSPTRPSFSRIRTCPRRGLEATVADSIRWIRSPGAGTRSRRRSEIGAGSAGDVGQRFRRVSDMGDHQPADLLRACQQGGLVT